MHHEIREGCGIVEYIGWYIAFTLSRQDGCVCSDTLPVLVHPKTTHALYEQPSVVCLRTGDAHLVDQDEPGFERLSSTSSTTILASTRRGSVHRIVPSGVNSWRQLCPAKDAPPDDDDDEIGVGDSKYGVSGDPLFTGHVTQPNFPAKTAYNGDTRQ